MVKMRVSPLSNGLQPSKDELCSPGQACRSKLGRNLLRPACKSSLQLLQLETVVGVHLQESPDHVLNSSTRMAAECRSKLNKSADCFLAPVGHFFLRMFRRPAYGMVASQPHIKLLAMLWDAGYLRF